MKTKIITTIAIILALPLVFAMYGGESSIIEFSFETDNCTISPNVTEGINFTFEGNNVLVESQTNFIGSFNITCYDWLTRTEETYEEESSGSSGIYTYPWRNKINETIDNKTEQNKTIEDKPKDNNDSNKLVKDTTKIEDLQRKIKKIQLISGILTLIIILVVGLKLWKANKNSKQ